MQRLWITVEDASQLATLISRTITHAQAVPILTLLEQSLHEEEEMTDAKDSPTRRKRK